MEGEWLKYALLGKMLDALGGVLKGLGSVLYGTGSFCFFLLCPTIVLLINDEFRNINVLVEGFTLW